MPQIVPAQLTPVEQSSTVSASVATGASPTRCTSSRRRPSTRSFRRCRHCRHPCGGRRARSRSSAASATRRPRSSFRQGQGQGQGQEGSVDGCPEHAAIARRSAIRSGPSWPPSWCWRCSAVPAMPAGTTSCARRWSGPRTSSPWRHSSRTYSDESSPDSIPVTTLSVPEYEVKLGLEVIAGTYPDAAGTYSMMRAVGLLAGDPVAADVGHVQAAVWTAFYSSADHAVYRLDGTTSVAQASMIVALTRALADQELQWADGNVALTDSQRIGMMVRVSGVARYVLLTKFERSPASRPPTRPRSAAGQRPSPRPCAPVRRPPDGVVDRRRPDRGRHGHRSARRRPGSVE